MSITKPNLRGRNWLERGCDAYAQGDVSGAVLHFQRASRLGDAHAQVNLGNLYDAGEGVEKNFDLAVRYYKLAIKKGLPQAAYNLGIAYRTQGNERLAQFWFKRAAEMGDEDAGMEIAQSGKGAK